MKLLPIDIRAMSEEHAIEVFNMMRNHFGWEGTIFTIDDVQSMVEQYVGPETDTDTDAVTIKKITQGIVDSPFWRRVMTDSLVHEGWEILEEAFVHVVNAMGEDDGNEDHK